MAIISVYRPPVKPTRRTARPAVPFGFGVFPRLSRFEPTPEDRQWAAGVFGADPEPDFDALAAEAAFVDAAGALMPLPVDYCRSCGQPAEVDRDRLCGECSAFADRAATPY